MHKTYSNLKGFFSLDFLSLGYEVVAFQEEYREGSGDGINYNDGNGASGFYGDENGDGENWEYIFCSGDAECDRDPTSLYYFHLQ